MFPQKFLGIFIRNNIIKKELSACTIFKAWLINSTFFFRKKLVLMVKNLQILVILIVF